MSAPTPAPGDDRPREGYYPDPSIPGYVRYWNGVAWVPGTSRPAPAGGEPLSPPSGARPAGPSVEETGPHFFDEDPVEEPRQSPAEAQHGSRPEPAAAWGADRSQQSGFGGDQDRRVSWGAAGDPRLPLAGRSDGEVPHPDGAATRTDGTATIRPADPGARTDSGPASGTGPASGSGPVSGSGSSPAPDGTVMFRRPTRGEGAGAAAAGTSGTGGPAPSEGAMTFRAPSPRTGEQARDTGAAASGPGQPTAHPASSRAAARQALGLDPEAPEPAPQQRAALPRQQPPAPAPSAPATGQPPQQPAGSLSQQPAASLPRQSAAPAATPMTSGPGGGQPSWAQQVHQLASSGAQDAEEGARPVAPWKPPVDDPFQAAARAQAAARPAGLGKRLAARLLDTLVLAAVTGVAAVPLGTRAIDHVHAKIDAAKLSGQTVTVWLLDGTTSVYLAIVLAVLLGFGVLYEVLPTARWGRTLGKKLCGLEVRDIEGHEPPAFGPALRRWLVYSVPGLLVVGVVGVLWCLFDRPWHQCWHDKAAHTFVAG